MLESYITERRKNKDILLMTHIVAGYPSFDQSLQTIESMVDAGVDLMELQIPFSEPMADGPVILRANAEALAAGARVEQSVALAAEVTRRFDIPFLFMTYYNIVHSYGVVAFANMMHDCGIKGAIIPDLPPEEGEEYLEALDKLGLAPIQLYSPNTGDERMRYLDQYASGFIYCVARKGVTGANTHFSTDIDQYMGRCRAATSKPLALGFGVKNRADVEYLKGKADIAVVGSETIRLIDQQGVEAVGPFIRSLCE